jgi:hypothetical protein
MVMMMVIMMIVGISNDGSDDGPCNKTISLCNDKPSDIGNALPSSISFQSTTLAE